MPSWPSADTRWAAMLSVVSADDVTRLPRQHLTDERLRRGDGVGRRRQDLVHVSLDGLVQLRLGHDRHGRARSLARARRRTATRSGTARARPRRRSCASTYGEITAGRMPSFTSRETEHRILGGDDDVADRGEPDAAAERGAVDAADQRHRQRVEALEHPRDILRVRRFSAGCRRSPSTSRPRSAPAQNALPAPASTTPRTGSVRARFPWPRRQLRESPLRRTRSARPAG